MVNPPEFPMYTIFENPSDYPGLFVVRRFNAVPGSVEVGEVLGTATTLEEARRLVPPEADESTPRRTDDDPTIVEIWF